MNFIEEEELDGIFTPVNTFCFQNFPHDYILWHGPLRHPIDIPYPTRLPSTIFYDGSHIITISRDLASFETIHSLIFKKLNSIEGLQIHYDTCCWKWKIEYGTRPVSSVLTHNQKIYYKLKLQAIEDAVQISKLAAYMGVSPLYLFHKNIRSIRDICKYISIGIAASQKALTWFPHLEPEIDDIIPEMVPLSLLRWCEMDISYFENENTFILVFNKEKSGNKHTFMSIFNEIDKALGKNNLCWKQRASYVMLMDGLEKKEKQEEKKSHISRYLFNKCICMEISTYMKQN